MKRNYKRVYGYAIIMIICVIIIVLVAGLSENKLEGYQEEYVTAITGSQKQIEALEQELANLKNENEELKNSIQKTAGLQSELETGNQALSDMKDIYELYKSGDKAQAKKAFEKIEPIGFDDASLAYYELLKDYLN